MSTVMQLQFQGPASGVMCILLPLSVDLNEKEETALEENACHISSKNETETHLSVDFHMYG